MTPLFENRDNAEAAAHKLNAFAQSQRLMILSLLLAKGEQSVSEIDSLTGIGQPAMSQQLSKLRQAGLVSTRRQSKQVYYSLAEDGAARFMQSIESVFDPTNEGSGVVQPDALVPLPAKDIASSAANFIRFLSAP